MQIRQNSSFILWFCFLSFFFKYYEFDEHANPKKKFFKINYASGAPRSDLNK